MMSETFGSSTSQLQHVDYENEDNVFVCAQCALHAKYEYHGTQAPFAGAFKFREDAYLLRDPFQAHNKSDSSSYLQLGADCAKCAAQVCVAATCSVFYGQRLCKKCALTTIQSFPAEVQQEMRKAFAATSKS